MKTYTTHVIADTENGIQKVDPIDYLEAEWLSFANFRKALRTLGNGEQVFCAVDPEQLEAINEEYGVH